MVDYCKIAKLAEYAVCDDSMLVRYEWRRDKKATDGTSIGGLNPEVDDLLLREITPPDGKCAQHR